MENQDEAVGLPAQRLSKLPTDRISIDEAKAALLRSGYLLEHRVETLLRNSKWYVEANTAYHDPESGKSRELDLYALKLFYQNKEFHDAVFGSLVVECVNNPQPLALIVKKESFSALLFQSDIKFVLDPDEILLEGVTGEIPVGKFLQWGEFHHYCDGNIATQYCSFVRKDKGKPNSEWMAHHDGGHFESFNTLVKALEHRLKGFEYFEGKHLRGEFLYPVLILQGDLLEVRVSQDGVNLIPAQHLKYRRSMIWDQVERNYIIDVVTESGLTDFLAKIEPEVRLLAGTIRENAETLRQNIRVKERAAAQPTVE